MMFRATALVTLLLFSLVTVDAVDTQCALCDYFVNIVEGWANENASEAIIEKEVQAVCALLPQSWQATCDLIIPVIPYIVSSTVKGYPPAKVCMDINLCHSTIPPRPDLTPMPVHYVNLDLPPVQRWVHICANPTYKNIADGLYSYLNNLPNRGHDIEALGTAALNLFPSEYAQEIIGCAGAFNISRGILALMNLAYELSDTGGILPPISAIGCTSLIAESLNGNIFHARNLDFGAGLGFTDDLRNMTAEIHYQASGKTLYKATHFIGYVGVLTGLKQGAFSFSINTRFRPGTLWQQIEDIVKELLNPNAQLVGFLTRNVLNNAPDWTTATYMLSNTPITCDVYFTVAGVSSGQGVVITRNETGPRDLWYLDSAKGTWFILETNYDHWTSPPWFDDRVVPGDNAMIAMGAKGLSIDGLINVLSVKPVLNLMTTYTNILIPSNGTFIAKRRYCNDPCPL